jgi:hypothetical protein
MNKLFFNYRPVIISGLILFSLLTAMILKNGDLKDFFIGVATGAALIAFGQSIVKVRSQEKNKYAVED